MPTFANVALTDSFDTWRVRTNQIIQDVNTSTDAGLSNALVRRDTTGHGGIRVDALVANGQDKISYLIFLTLYSNRRPRGELTENGHVRRPVLPLFPSKCHDLREPLIRLNEHILPLMQFF